MVKTVSHLTEKEIKREGWKALVEKLGLAGATNFILQYETGEGDYTKERKKIFGNKTVTEIVKNIKTKFNNYHSGTI